MSYETEQISGLYGTDKQAGIVAFEHVQGDEDEIAVISRESDGINTRFDRFRPFIILNSNFLKHIAPPFDLRNLDGNGFYDSVAYFANWSDCLSAKQNLEDKTGLGHGAPGAPYIFLNDPVHQYLLVSGKTSFIGMDFESLLRMQIDIECRSGQGYEFCNAKRETDSIVAIGLADSSGWSLLLSAKEMSETEMLEKFVQAVIERDPDVIEGHNIFNFDLPYLTERAKLRRVKLAIGRNRSIPKARPSRFTVGERTISYTRFDIWGRHVVDTMFLAHLYDISHRSLPGFGLKEVARHFNLASENRTYLDAAKIGDIFDKNPEKVLAYLKDDVKETGAIASLLSRSAFAQAQFLPFSYQNTIVRGNAAKIDALMMREYLAHSASLPEPDAPKEFSGGYTDIFVSGLVKNVHHCDVRSLYPSLMLLHRIKPRSDELGVFLNLLENLRKFRLDSKKKMINASTDQEKTHYDALQTAFKIIINSFYGYLGCSQARFCDFSAAEKVTSEGRELLRKMIEWLRSKGAAPVEIDTDGIYFVPPKFHSDADLEKFRSDFIAFLPPGIDIEFDGEYVSMFSYKMKNYALLGKNGEMIIKGAALKSRGLEPFQREFMKELLFLKLSGRDEELSALKEKYEKAILRREWPVEMFAKTEMLQESPATYLSKRARKLRARSAVYELALRSGREYRAGDTISYYVSGEKASVALVENAKLVSEWDPNNRDENVNYYLAKIQAIWKKFCNGDSGQKYLDLEENRDFDPSEDEV